MSNDTVKPPLGLMPEFIHKEKRLQEIDDAIYRYLDAGLAIPDNWIVEHYIIKEWLKNREEEKESALEPSHVSSLVGVDWEIWESVTPNGYVHKVGYCSEAHPDCISMGCKIHSVKRLSDNTNWVLGEIVATVDGKMEIGEFINYKDQIMYVKIKDRGHTWRLEELKKAPKEEKPVLFTTEDGFSVREGDTVWFTMKDFKIDYYDFIDMGDREKDLKHYPEFHKYFSTKEKAEEYVKMNKPCYSLNDIKEACDETGLAFRYAWLIEQLLKQNKGGK